jgi:hypothetical protein
MMAFLVKNSGVEFFLLNNFFSFPRSSGANLAKSIKFSIILMAYPA